MGLVIGIAVTLFTLYLFSTVNKNDNEDLGLKLFKEKGECIKTKNEIKIFQVIEANMALAKTGDYPDEIVLLLINYDGKSYYDDQKIIVPAKKCARQIGTYKYSTKMEIDKTVPAVVIE